mgnify:CR=1 FL=1
MSNISRKLLMEILTCGEMRNIRDQARENVLYSSEVNNLCNILQEVLQSKDPQQSLLAEKYCIVFQRNYCTTNEAERDKLNDQLMKLADAQTSVSLVMEPERYREFARSSFMETREGRLPYHGCAVFVKTQIDTLNRSGQGTGIEAEKELWKLRKENLRACRDAFEVLQEEALFNAPEHEPQNAESPNMAEVQAAESKASLIQGLDKSADGMSAVEGKDVGYLEEGYMAAANEVKYEAQEARAANIEAQALKVGQRVTFQAKDKGGSVKLTGTVEELGATTVTLKCGSMSIPVAKESGVFSQPMSQPKEHTQAFARKQAMQSLGPGGKVLLARHKGTYSGQIIGKTSTFAIQKINENTAVLHRLKDLEGREKDAQGLLKEGNELTISRDGTNVSLSQLKPGERDNDKVRTQQKTRGSIGR